jgi:hypothetical protein
LFQFVSAPAAHKETANKLKKKIIVARLAVFVAPLSGSSGKNVCGLFVFIILHLCPPHTYGARLGFAQNNNKNPEKFVPVIEIARKLIERVKKIVIKSETAR